MKSLDDLRIEFARVQAREDGRPLKPCRSCGERNRVALGGAAVCYRCRSRHDVEGDHVRGSGSGPAVLRGDANLNRIAMEGERLVRDVLRDDLCISCIEGFALRVGIFVARLDVSP
jgi:hypothetical protein